LDVSAALEGIAADAGREPWDVLAVDYDSAAHSTGSTAAGKRSKAGAASESIAAAAGQRRLSRADVGAMVTDDSELGGDGAVSGGGSAVDRHLESVLCSLPWQRHRIYNACGFRLRHRADIDALLSTRQAQRLGVSVLAAVDGDGAAAGAAATAVPAASKSVPLLVPVSAIAADRLATIPASSLSHCASAVRASVMEDPTRRVVSVAGHRGSIGGGVLAALTSAAAEAAGHRDRERRPPAAHAGAPAGGQAAGASVAVAATVHAVDLRRCEIEATRVLYTTIVAVQHFLRAIVILQARARGKRQRLRFQAVVAHRNVRTASEGALILIIVVLC
jgi:hypothetical protein